MGFLDWGADSNIQNNKHSTVFDTLISTCNELELRQFTGTRDNNQEPSEKVILLNRLAEVVDFSDNNDRSELVQGAIRAGYIGGSIVESAYQRAKEISEARRFILK
ncbi:MAG: hypothetical protein EB127_12070 [Alphaproteobacteria bacterium]|nr:hypothetical protein [Alphaproteobacteria bacterium]